MDKCRLAHGRLHFCTSFLHWRRELLSFCTYSFRTGAERAAGVDKIVDNLWIMYNLWIKLSTGVDKSVDKFFRFFLTFLDFCGIIGAYNQKL